MVSWHAGGMKRTWPHDWQARRAGQDCPKCGEGRPETDRWGVRFFAGQWADAYLERRPPQPGTAVVVFRGTRHVADPCDFTDDELAGYWADVRTAAKAIEHAYRPCQLNYATLGNAVPPCPHPHHPALPRRPRPRPPPAGLDLRQRRPTHPRRAFDTGQEPAAARSRRGSHGRPAQARTGMMKTNLAGW